MVNLDTGVYSTAYITASKAVAVNPASPFDEDLEDSDSEYDTGGTGM